MGIPKFFSRVREYGATGEIGRRTTTSSASQSQSHSHRQSTKLAIIDGPSLAHYLFEQLAKEEHADEKVQCFYRYATLGETAIKWLDNLRSLGFEIEGIYFDGSLPAAKWRTRLDRLQKHTDNLIKYRQKRARYAESIIESLVDTTLAYYYLSTNTKEREELVAAQRKLPTPPFLVSAVIEALVKSSYATKTWVVSGEADAFCAAAAHEASYEDYRNKIRRSISIFTNDSDLLIWNTGRNTTIVMIREIKEQDIGNERVMEALWFAPTLLASPLPDLLKPAFRMRDPEVTFLQAISKPTVDDRSPEFVRFAAEFERAYPLFKHPLLQKEREDQSEVLIQDPRTSELVRHYLWALHKDPRCEAQESSTESTQKPKFLDTSKLDEITKKDLDAAQAAQEPVDPFDNDEPDIMQLEMFLPSLLEDPTKSAAWRIGEAFRDVAETLLMLPFDGYHTRVLEYKRSGNSIVPRKVKRTSIKRLGVDMTSYLDYTRNALSAAKELDRQSQWRFVVMEWTMSNMDQVENIRADRKHPEVSEIVKIVNGDASSSWTAIHLFARYQAEYYSLRMLKEIFDFCRDRAEFKRLNLPGSVIEFADELSGLPGIAEFFGTTGRNTDEERWQKLHAAFVERQKADDA